MPSYLLWRGGVEKCLFNHTIEILFFCICVGDVIIGTEGAGLLVLSHDYQLDFFWILSVHGLRYS